MNDTLDSKKLWKLSIKELRSVCQPKEKLQSSNDTWFTRLVSRRFSIYFTKLFYLMQQELELIQSENYVNHYI